MIRKLPLASIILCTLFAPCTALNHDAAIHSEVLRGEVWVELEPIYGFIVDESYPLDIQTAGRRALEEAAVYYSAMIYGWAFHYDIGERARQIPEEFELKLTGLIPFADPGLKVTDIKKTETQFRVWTDYNITVAQQRRVLTWTQDSKLNIQGLGYSPLAGTGVSADWKSIKIAALEDAARSALRAALRGSERNRPKEVSGFISLTSFPRYFVSKGQWVCSARFRVEIQEIIPFAAH